MNWPLHYTAMTALCFAALSALALAMDKHAAQVQMAGAASRILPPLPLRIMGWALLACAAALCIRAEGVGIGLVAWCGVFTAAGVPLVLLITYRPASLPATAMAAAVISLLLIPVAAM
jgi:hypothetical protein